MLKRFILVAAAVLSIVSAGALALLGSGEVIPSVVRDPISDFVQPGVTVWWLVLGGPFRSAPSSLTGIAFAAASNAALWLLVIWFAVAIVRSFRRMFTTPRA